MDDEEIGEIYEEFAKREATMIQSSYYQAVNRVSKYKIEQVEHKGKKNREFKASGKIVFGFLKCIARGLLCIIPVSPVQAVGAGLALNGLNDCIDAAREQGEQNEKE